MQFKIRIKKSRECDVFIMGAGIAGIMSAIQASGKGMTVIISSSSHIFSGSSFYPGTWGLSLVGPENNEDKRDLINTIKRVGCNVIDESLVETLVDNIPKAIKLLKTMNIELKEAFHKKEKEFIPCFDYKVRNWNGIVFSSMKQVLGEKLRTNNVIVYPFSEVIDIVKDGEDVVGVILINRDKQFEFIKCKAIVIASGGFGSIFKYRLNTDDINGMGQYLALKYGCKLVNMEFIQMMLGYVNSFPKIIFNEKTFKYVDFINSKGEDILAGMENKLEKLEKRSAYGPFTSRLDSREIDFRIFHEFTKDKNGVYIKYKDEIKNNHSEFIKMYFKWLDNMKTKTVDHKINLGFFYHAANGGIKINKKAETGVNGLFAAGEVTGGMHGADRIGGLSTANALVFGNIAGVSAREYACNVKMSNIEEVDFEAVQIENAQESINQLQDIMFKAAMIERNKTGISDAIKMLKQIQDNLAYAQVIDMKSINKSYRLKANLLLAQCLLKAMNLRKESRGSHYRSDYNEINPNMNKMIIIEMNNNRINVHFQ